jgi:hypothetical protein
MGARWFCGDPNARMALHHFSHAIMSRSAATTRGLRDNPMHFSVLVIAVVGALLAAMPANAQTYDPRYPVCMHVYGELQGERMDCVFGSRDECNKTASGLPALCIDNPYYAGPGPRQKRPRRH